MGTNLRRVMHAKIGTARPGRLRRAVAGRKWSLRQVSLYIDILIIIINFSYSTCIRSFFGRASLLLCSFLNVFSVFIYIYRKSLNRSLPQIEACLKLTPGVLQNLV